VNTFTDLDLELTSDKIIMFCANVAY